jgi:DNA repair exonuclease SbcCD nuclease subunit
MTLPDAGPAREETPRRRSLRVIHTSDVHIDWDVFSGERRESARRRVQGAFKRVVDTLREERADLFLIAGDLFDSSRVDRGPVDFVMSELSRVSCPVVLLPGNHDCYDEHSVYRRVDFSEAGSQVHVVTAVEGERLEFPDLDATVWGRAMVDHDPSNQPLADIPPRLADCWNIGVAHGLLATTGAELRSSLITPRQIEDSGLDYLAMGHLHVFREVSQRSTRACYSGSPVPLVPDGPKGGSVALVDLDPVSGVTLSEWSIG